ncbi:MAG TPA: hypothetical protein PKL92_09170, partial [Aquaticitalea sp.]|nr:hypothetical protein [Aquaticitalea sp.]
SFLVALGRPLPSPLYATAVGLVMDGLKRQERKRRENDAEEAKITATETIEPQQTKADGPIVDVREPKKERRSFLDKLTERVKDFLDNAE